MPPLTLRVAQLLEDRIRYHQELAERWVRLRDLLQTDDPIPVPSPMAHKAPTGTCKLCGETKKLTKEHLPAKGGYPTPSRVQVLSGDQVLTGGAPKPYQNGFWDYALCEDCNRMTGRLYGPEFAAWTRWGFEFQHALASPEGKVRAYRGYPARIAKQVASTLIASSQPGFADQFPHLRSFVLERDAVLSEDEFRLAVYLVGSGTGRSTGLAAVEEKGKPPHWMVEVALPPFGYVLTVSGDPLDSRPASIGWFASRGYDDECVIEIPHLHVLPTHEVFPGDYRTRDEMRRDVIVNILIAEGHPAPADEARRIIEANEAKGFFATHGVPWDRGFAQGILDADS